MEGSECHFFQTLREGSIFFLSGLGMRVIPPNLKGKECNLSLIFFFFFFLAKYARLVWVSYKSIKFHPHSGMLKNYLSLE